MTHFLQNESSNQRKWTDSTRQAYTKKDQPNMLASIGTSYND